MRIFTTRKCKKPEAFGGVIIRCSFSLLWLVGSFGFELNIYQYSSMFILCRLVMFTEELQARTDKQKATG